MINDDYAPSPVLSDTWLWEQEKPFTAFGQHGEGMLDLRVFDQDVWWVDIKGQEHLLEEMTTDYLMNVLSHLQYNRYSFHLNSGKRYAIEVILSINDSEGMPEHMEGYRNYVAEKIDPMSTTAENWLETTILHQRIVTILTNRGVAELEELGRS